MSKQREWKKICFFSILYFAIITGSAIVLSQLNEESLIQASCMNSMLCPSSSMMAVEQAMLRMA